MRRAVAQPKADPRRRSTLSASPADHVGPVLCKYLYANANPLTGFDPSGHMDATLSSFGATVALIGTLAYLAVPNVWHQFSTAVTQLCEIAIQRILMTGEEIETTIGGLISGSVPGKKSSSKQFWKPGGKAQQEEDFDGIPVATEPKGGDVEVKTLPDGTKIIRRPSSSGYPTIEIDRPAGKPGNHTKIRYKDDPPPEPPPPPPAPES